MNINISSSIGSPARASRFRRLRRPWILLLVGISICIVGGLRFGGQLLGTILTLDTPQLKHVDAAVVLPGSIPDRALQAFDMIQDGMADSVLLINDGILEGLQELRGIGVPVYSHAELNRFILLRLHVPEDRIRVLPHQSRSTWEDALALKEFLRTNPLQSVAIVTCKYHAAPRRRICIPRPLARLQKHSNAQRVRRNSWARLPSDNLQLLSAELPGRAKRRKKFRTGSVSYSTA